MKKYLSALAAIIAGLLISSCSSAINQESISTQTTIPTGIATSIPSSTPTVTPEPTLVPATAIPYPTPAIDWSEDSREWFMGSLMEEIFFDVDFIRQFPCPRQGIDWSPTADPLQTQYFSDITACLYVPANPFNNPRSFREANRKEAEAILQDPNNEYCSGHRCDNDTLIYLFLAVGPQPAGDYDYDLDTWNRPEISDWEWCLFLERNYLQFGWNYYRNDATSRTKKGDLTQRLISKLGNSSSPLYCPNFDSDSDWCSHNECVINNLGSEPEPTRVPAAAVLIPTPVVSWSEDAREWFIGYLTSQIFYDVDFIRHFPCPRQGIDWSPAVDPLQTKYFSDIIACLSIPKDTVNMPGVSRYATREEAEAILQDPNNEYCSVHDCYDFEAEYWFTAEGPIPRDVNDPDWYNDYGLDTWNRPEISEWEWCLFLERNYLQYGWSFYQHDGTNRTKEGYLTQRLIANLGDPSSPLYCPNFDADSDWCLHNECVINNLGSESE